MRELIQQAMSYVPLFTYASQQLPEVDGKYECLIHDYEAGPYLYIETLEFKGGVFQDQAEIVGWRAKGGE